MMELRNEHCYISYKPEDKKIHGADNDDKYNGTVFYNTTSRSCKKAWAALEKLFTPQTTMYGALGILEDNGVRCHSYCSVD